MGGVMDFFLGGEATPSESSSKQVSTMTPAQKALINKLSTTLTGQIGQGVAPYRGQMVAGPSRLETRGMSAIDQMLRGGGTYGDIMNRVIGYDPAAGTTGRMGASQFDLSKILGPTATGLGEVVGPTESTFDRDAATAAFRESVMEPTIGAWESEVLPAVLERFAGTGTMSSSGAHRAATKAGQELMSNLGATLAGQLYSGEQAAKERAFTGQEAYAGRSQTAMENALARAMGAGESYAGRVSEGLGQQFGAEESLRSRLTGLESGSQANLLNALGMTSMPINLAMSAGGTSRDIQNQQLQSEYQKWMSKQAYQNPWLQMLGTTLGVNPYGIGQTSTGGTPASQGMLGWAGSFFGGSGGIYT